MTTDEKNQQWAREQAVQEERAREKVKQRRLEEAEKQRAEMSKRKQERRDKRDGVDPDKPYAEYGLRPITKALVAEVLRRDGGKKVPSPAHKKIFDDAEARWLAEREEMMRHTTTRAHEAFKAQQRALKDGTFGGQTIKAKTAFEEEAVLRRRAIKERLRKLSGELLPTYREIAREIETSAKRVADRMEELERRECEAFSIPFSPSATLIAIRQLSWRLSVETPEAGTPQSPKMLMSFLPL